MLFWFGENLIKRTAFFGKIFAYFFVNCLNMKKIERKVMTSWGHEITLTVDVKLNKLKGKILAPKKLEEANKHLRKMKSLPK
jgi:hypothetical protein